MAHGERYIIVSLYYRSMRQMIQTLRRYAVRTRETLAYLPQTWRLVWEPARGLVIVWLGLLLAQGVLPAGSVYLTKLLVDRLIFAMRYERAWEHCGPVVAIGGWLILILVLTEGLRAATSLVSAAQSEKLRGYITDLIHRQSIALDFAFYEQSEFYDHLHQARNEASLRPVMLLENLGNLLRDGVMFLSMMVVLFPFGWQLPLILILSALPAFVFVLKHTLRQYEWQRQTTAERRRAHYYERLLTTGETAAEMRIFELGDHFREAYRQLLGKLYRSKWRLAKEQSLAEFGAGFVALSAAGATLAWMGWRTLHGAFTLGTLALFYQSFNNGQQLLRSSLGHVGQLYSNSLFLSNLFKFLDLKPRIIEPARPIAAPSKLIEGVRIADLSFAYPGSSRPIFQNFNLTVPAGRIVALVGLNGAGKTTLIKLLCRLYDPDQGRVEIDGVDIRSLGLTELRRLITVLFQEPVHYYETVRRNVQLGSLHQPITESELMETVAAVGATDIIERLPQGYETVLGKWFADGAELSVGQWQRLAMARAFLRPSPIVLLDEPTSAMDSWAENDWLKRFRSLMAGRSVLLITHRFTTAMQADHIHVMVGGNIVESGAHHDLLALDGLYAQSWRNQTTTRN